MSAVFDENDGSRDARTRQAPAARPGGERPSAGSTSRPHRSAKPTPVVAVAAGSGSDRIEAWMSF